MQTSCLQPGRSRKGCWAEHRCDTFWSRPLNAPRTEKSIRRRLHHWLVRVWRSILFLDDTPHRVALGVSVGTFIAFLPMVGVQMATGAFVSWCLRGNPFAAVPMAWITNALTLVPIYYMTYLVGAQFTGGSLTYDEIRAFLDQMIAVGGFLAADGWRLAFDMLSRTVAPLFIGGALVGLVIAGMLYPMTKGAVIRFQQAKLRRRVRWLERLRAQQLAGERSVTTVVSSAAPARQSAPPNEPASKEEPTACQTAVQRSRPVLSPSSSSPSSSYPAA